MCTPRNNNRGRPDKYADHPKTIYIREDALMDAVSRFFADRLFGASRRAILDADLASLGDRAEREHNAERERLQRALADIMRRQNSVMRQAQEGDPDDPFTRALRGTYNELDAERAAMLAAIAALDVAADAEPTRPSPADEALLDALPYLAGNVTTVEQMGEAIGKTPGQSCRTLVASRDMGGLSSHPHGPRRCRRPGPPTVAGPCRPGRM
jgi:hypothetical protein